MGGTKRLRFKTSSTDIKSGVKKEEAEEWKAKFEEVGATVELK